MDSTLDVMEVAGRLGVDPRRVVRACRNQLGVERSRSRTIDATTFARLRDTWGVVPATLPTGLSRNDVLVLTALVRAPRGFLSARAVGVRTRLAPTTASRSLTRLQERGMVEQRRENRLMRGRSQPMDVWYACLLAPAVEGLLDLLNGVELPAHPRPRATGPLPDHLWHLVWNADPVQIHIEDHKEFLAHRVLVTGDPEGIAWAVDVFPANVWRRVAEFRGLSERDRGYARTIAEWASE